MGPNGEHACARSLLQVRADGAPAVGDVVGRAGGRDRIDSRGQAQQHVVGEGHLQEFAQSAAELGSRCGLQPVRGAEGVGLARVGQAAKAGAAAAAGELEGDGHARSGVEGHRVAGLDDLRDRLVAEGERAGVPPGYRLETILAHLGLPLAPPSPAPARSAEWIADRFD